MVRPDLSEIKNGWAARWDGWAVFGVTQEEALQKFHEAVALREKISRQPFIYEQGQKDAIDNRKSEKPKYTMAF